MLTNLGKTAETLVYLIASFNYTYPVAQHRELLLIPSYEMMQLILLGRLSNSQSEFIVLKIILNRFSLLTCGNILTVI